ncbi:pentapeptide repeat-containing protein [Pseudobacteroides cellulosolvens]|uniref:NACHT-associated inactive Restriction Endonuclease 2 domain-containing protein n=1 Tax=Pseudobacteroides cellulosolvens ATCC 35603 = DSM 2933 TaxID=398512 RepID=A0A0L6JXU9_9FIRM|nr:pentapeptide repeat-containing protein [Pseudobacteroides cellulosolvens]KNY30584.1 hypothetical protein Bccel_5864 [Pseudobacteroides cellulosolvens ATCC 35603 = DSM 2933]
MINVDKLDKLYERYDFKKSNQYADAIVYTHTNGYFNNAEIVTLEEGIDVSDIIVRYQEAGFSCKNSYYTDIEEVHAQLFKGFFSVLRTRDKLKGEYYKYCQNQNIRLKFDYSYISCNYFFDGKEQTDSVVSKILSIINSNGPHLVILEAAAGYGKTCTAYELLKELVTSDSDGIPIFTELSRNRKAAVFKYVLLDEIDRLFHHLKSDLVTYEMAEGRIPVIIDGFDELISKSVDMDNKLHDKHSKSFDDMESMLDTIGDLLTHNTKIILTSRKSAIFNGDKFNNWVEGRENRFKVTRLILHEPNIKDWLGTEKIEILKYQNIPYESFGNPVLLAHLRNMSCDKFNNYCKDSEEVIKDYLIMLLEREKERQDIHFTVEEQLEIFIKLVYEMVELDITSEDRDFIKDIILVKNRNLINVLRSRYPQGLSQKAEDIASTLARHALLDRVGTSKNTNKIGFINDFIFGLLIGECICKLKNDWLIDYKYIDLACTAYSARSADEKVKLYLKLKPITLMLHSQEQIEIDIKLNNQLSSNHKDASFYSVTFKNFIFPDGFSFTGCTFSQCIFNKIEIRKSSFYSCIFIDCRFYDCTILNDTQEDRKLIFSNCFGDDISPLKTKDFVTSDDDYYYEKIVLQQFWQKGRANAQPNRAYRTLFAGVPTKQYYSVENAIESLRRKGILEKQGELVYLNYEYIGEVRNILSSGEGDINGK